MAQGTFWVVRPVEKKEKQDKMVFQETAIRTRNHLLLNFELSMGLK